MVNTKKGVEMKEPLNEYDFPILDLDECPERPDKLFVKKQLVRAIEKLDFVPEYTEIKLNEQFRTTVLRCTHDDRNDRLEKMELGWSVFDKEETLNGDGWVVLVSAIKHEIDS
jgi:hypothetical protein